MIAAKFYTRSRYDFDTKETLRHMRRDPRRASFMLGAVMGAVVGCIIGATFL